MACYRLKVFTFTFMYDLTHLTIRGFWESHFQFGLRVKQACRQQKADKQRKFHYATRRLVEQPHTKFHRKPISTFKTETRAKDTNSKSLVKRLHHTKTFCFVESAHHHVWDVTTWLNHEVWRRKKNAEVHRNSTESLEGINRLSGLGVTERYHYGR